MDKPYKVNSATVNTFAHISSINSSTGPDRIRIRGNFRGVFGNVSGVTDATGVGALSKSLREIVYISNAKFSKKNFITINDGSNSEIKLVTDETTSQVALDTNLSFKHVNKCIFNGIDDITYSIGSSTESPKVPELKRDNKTSGDQPVMQNVEELQFQYGMDTDANGFVDAWVNYIGQPATVGGITYTTTLSMLKEVRIWMLVRSSVPDPKINDTKTYVMGDRSYTPPATDPYNSTINPRKHRRILFTTSVTLRNFRVES